MSTDTYRLLTAATHFLPALLWGVIVWDVCTWIRKRRPTAAFPWVILGLTSCVTLHFAAWTVTALLVPSLQGPSLLRGVLVSITDGSVILLMAFGRHTVLLWPVRVVQPSRRWLITNYGLCAAVLGVITYADLRLLPGSAWLATAAIYNGYLSMLGAAALWDLRRVAGSGWWRPGVLWDARSADVIALGLAFSLVVLNQLMTLLSGTIPMELLLRPEPSAAALRQYALNGLAGLMYATPLVIRNLGDLIPGFIVGVASCSAVAAVLVGVQRLAGSDADAGLVLTGQLAAVVGIVFIITPARTWLNVVIGRVFFRRGRLRWSEMQHCVYDLSPERGIRACCQQTLAEVVRVMGLRGAAIMLHDGTVVQEGQIRIEPLVRVWPRDGRGLPPRHLGQSDFKELPAPLLAALADADVLAAIRIVSPRRHWGHVFVTTDLRGASFGDEDDAAVGAVADQLALVLDAADLLVRTVDVERSLAHAEKLAAIGELAARVAHEIRNPVTAARSLAQQLARDPASPLNAEHAGLIVEELERVERQVRDLLRYARREELRPEPLDLSALVGAVTHDLGPKLEQAGIDLALDIPPAIMAPADREKLRQVMINLIENAIDALALRAAPRRLAVSVTRDDGRARLRVADNGPGVSAAALPRLFEPFFSLKPNGTGLGLAIAKRTIDAHGGAVVVESREGEGARFDVFLPLARAAA